MPISDTSIYFIIAILGLAYPVSLTVVTRLDDKYKSTIIVQLFRRSFAFRAFQILLILALIFVAIQVFWIINFKPLPDAQPKFVFHDWADISLYIITTFLLVAFFLFTRKVFQFYAPLDLIAFLRKKPDDNERLGFKAMAALLYAGMEISDDTLVTTISREFTEVFKRKRTNAGQEPVQYPVEYYGALLEIIERTHRSPLRKIQHIGYSAASGRWLIGEMEYTQISELTYGWLWRNLRLMVELERDDFVMAFWKNSQQVIRTGLSALNVRANRNPPFEILNKKEVDQRQKERSQFFVFHTALGGMLLYAGRNRLISQLFGYTTSSPPQYDLLPMTMSEVLDLFIQFWNSNDLFFPYRYQFPGNEGIKGEDISREYISRYTALLFVRQYFLTSYLYGYEPVARPNGPNTQAERTVWLQSLDYFRRYVADIQENQELLSALGYQPLTDAWAEQHHKPAPEQLLSDLITRIQLAYRAEEVEQRAEEEKKDSFRNRSREIIDERIASYRAIQNAKLIENNYNVALIRGGHVLYKKAAFANNQGTTYLNYDTFFASGIASDITRQMTALFKNKATETYLFRAPQLFEAIDRLHLNAAQHLLINFGVDIGTVQRQHHIERLTPNSYKGIPIVKLEYINQSVMRSSVVAVRKADLPYFLFSPPDEREIERFGLTPLSAETQLYGSVVDLNERPELQALFVNEPLEEVEKSVVLALELNVHIRWRNKFKMIRLALYSEFYQQGIVNEVTEMSKF